MTKSGAEKDGPFSSGCEKCSFKEPQRDGRTEDNILERYDPSNHDFGLASGTGCHSHMVEEPLFSSSTATYPRLLRSATDTGTEKELTFVLVDMRTRLAMWQVRVAIRLRLAA
jgi:hypothetical protein